MIICEDLGFNIFHRLMHWKYLYPYFHKVHHELPNTVSIIAQHLHPIDYAIGVLIPGAIAPGLLGKHLHYGVYLIWIIFRTGEGIDRHTGYEFPWSIYGLIPFSASASYHDFHHSHNVGNYSSFMTIWDSVFGDNAPYLEFKRLKEIEGNKKID